MPPERQKDINCMDNRKKRIFIWLAAVVCLGVMALVGSTMMKAKAKEEQQVIQAAKKKAATAKPVEREKIARGVLGFGEDYYQYSDQIESYLLFGTDESGENTDQKTEEEYHGDLADFMMLLIINRTKQKYVSIMIDRDTMVDVPLMNADGTWDTTFNMQLCLSHGYGGNIRQSDENTVYCVSQLFGGLDIDGYYSLNSDDIPKLNRVVGGVTVTIEDDFSKDDASLVQGETITLSDEQAVSFTRHRMTVGDGDNESRMRRQKVYMQGLLDKCKENMQADPAFINDFYKALLDVASTNMSGNAISKMANGILSYEDMGIVNLDGEHVTKESSFDEIVHMQFLVEQSSIVDAINSICALEECEAPAEKDTDDEVDEEDDFADVEADETSGEEDITDSEEEEDTEEDNDE